MADTTALKNRIRAAVKANDNQEITGPVLQQALLDIVDELNGATETEAEARQSGDSTLQQGINTEKQQRQDADTALGQRITQEIQQEAQRAEDAFNDLELQDVTGSGVQTTELHIALNKNDGSEQEPEIRNLTTIELEQASEQKAGLLPAKNTWDNKPTQNSKKLISSGDIYKKLADKSWYIQSPRISSPQIEISKDENHNIIISIPSAINVFDKQGGYRNITIGEYTVPTGKSLYLSTTENTLTPPDFSIKGTGEYLYLVLQNTLENEHADSLILSNWSGGIYSPFEIFYPTNTKIKNIEITLANIIKGIENRSWFITASNFANAVKVEEVNGHDMQITHGTMIVFDKFGGYYVIAAGTQTCHSGKALYLSTTENTLTLPDFSTKGLGTSLYLVEQAIMDGDGDGDVTHADSLVMANWAGGIYSPFEVFYQTTTEVKKNRTTLINRGWYLSCEGWSQQKSDNSIVINISGIGQVFDKLGGYRLISGNTFTVPAGKALYLSTTENTLTPPDLSVKGTAQTLYLVTQNVLDNEHNDFLIMANWSGVIYTPFANLLDDNFSIIKKNYTGVGKVNIVRPLGYEIPYPFLKNILSFEKSNMIDMLNRVENYYFIDGNFYAEPNYVVTRNPAPLERGKTYTVYGTNAHIDILDAATLNYLAHIPKVHDTDPDLNIIRDGSYRQFTIPDTDTFNNVVAVVTLRTVDEKIGWLNEGTIAQRQLVHYQAFRPTIGKQTNFKRILVVDINGCGDFTSLTEACEAASDGDTILVYPGLYDNEVCTAPESKTLHIIGVDREQCIIRGRADATYSTPPMHFSSGRIANLTIIQQNTGPGADNTSPYCVHLDWHNMKDHTINIDNCNFENHYRGGCLGIGLRGGCILTVKNCRFCAKHGGRALFLHDNNWDIAQYEGMQIYRSINCVYYMEDIETGDKTININGCGKETQAYTRDFSVSQFIIEFIGDRIKGGCKFGNVHSADVGTITADDFQGVKNLRLSDLSWGNSDSTLNAE